MPFRFLRLPAQRAFPSASTRRVCDCESLEGRRLLAGNSGIQAYIPPAVSDTDVHAYETDAVGGGRLLKRRAVVTPAATPNLNITNLFAVDGNNTAATPVTGQMIFLRATWNVTGMTVGTQYVIRFAVDGVPVDSGAVTHNGDGSYYWYRGGWYASPGSHTITATIDGAGVIAETSETDNTLTTSFTTAAPSTLLAKMIQPIGRERNKDWFIYNYADVDPRDGVRADYAGGPFQYDGHDAIDAGPANFAAQDRGISIHAALAGTVVQVLDGNFDRETSMGSRPGNYVLIDHGGGWQTLYYHFSNNTISVTVGQTVAAGQVIGLMGSAGSSTGTHVHFTLIKGGAVVETGYSLSTYWVDPPPYAGNAPSAVIDSWISNYVDTSEYGESVSNIDTFTTASPTTLYYTTWSNNWKTTDTFTIQFLRPNGTVAQTASYTPTSSVNLGYIWWSLPFSNWSTATGLWTALTSKNGAELNRRTFTVTSGAGKPEARLKQGTAMILDGRTTPLGLGTVAQNAAATALSFTLTNHGSAPLAVSGVSVPAGVVVTTALPASIAAGASATLAIAMDTTVIGPRTGEVAILTNDDDEARYTFNVSGSVTGTPGVTPETLSTTSAPGLPFRPGTAAKIVDPTVTLGTATSANYGGATLKADLYGGGVSAGDGLQLLAGDGVTLNAGLVYASSVATGTYLNTGTQLAITFFSNVSRATAQAVARRIAFASTSPNANGRRYVRLSITRPTDTALGTSVTKTISYDTLPRPAVTSVADVFATGQGVKAVFSSDVSASLTAADVTLTNAATGATVAAVPTIVHDPANRTETLTFRSPTNKLLPDGRYLVRLSAAGVTDSVIRPMYEDALLPFFILAGDIDHDAGVSINDFNTFAGNFGKPTGQTWITGDFDSDGGVSIDDFNLLSANFGKVV